MEQINVGRLQKALWPFSHEQEHEVYAKWKGKPLEGLCEEIMWYEVSYALNDYPGSCVQNC